MQINEEQIAMLVDKLEQLGREVREANQVMQKLIAEVRPKKSTSEMLQDAENTIKEARATSAQYRQPVLPDDAGKPCQFSDDGKKWTTDTLIGFSLADDRAPWEGKRFLWDHARIAVDKAGPAPSQQWEPQVGDWVMVSASGRSNVSVSISWCQGMNQYVGDARQISKILYEDSHGFVVSLEGCGLPFHQIWLEPMRKAQFDLG